MKKFQSFFIALVVLVVLTYGAYTYRDKFWPEDKSIPEVDYKSNFNNTSNSAGTNLIKEDSQNSSSESSSNTEDSSSAENQENTDNDQDDQKTETTGCDSKTGQEKYKCQEDLAIEKKDDSLCEAIADESIKEECVNAVAETILESF